MHVLIATDGSPSSIEAAQRASELLKPADHVTLTDIKGVVYARRDKDMPPNMARHARKTDARTLGEVLAGADVFLGLSAPNVLKQEWLPQMADKPLILALANPDPEILPELALWGLYHAAELNPDEC